MNLIEEITKKREIIETTYKGFPKMRDEVKTLSQFLEFLGYSMDQYESIDNLETDFLDSLLFILKKTLKRKKTMVDLLEIFWEGCLTPEGKKYLNLLEEHASTDFLKWGMLFKVFNVFQEEANMFIEMEGFGIMPHDFREE